MGIKVEKFIYWTPRILSIFFIAFLAMFSLDIFDSNSNFREIIIGLFIHNVPVFILIAVLAISWKHELVGAIAFILAGLLYMALTMRDIPLALAFSRSLVIAGPGFVIGVLFFIGWHGKRSNFS